MSMLSWGRTSPEELRCQAKPCPCHQGYCISSHPAIKPELLSTLTPCPITWDKTRLSSARLLVGREESENHSRNKWQEKTQTLMVQESEVTALKLFYPARAGPCPLE